jgi:hypothetical protein
MCREPLPVDASVARNLCTWCWSSQAGTVLVVVSLGSNNDVKAPSPLVGAAVSVQAHYDGDVGEGFIR